MVAVRNLAMPHCNGQNVWSGLISDTQVSGMNQFDYPDNWGNPANLLTIIYLCLKRHKKKESITCLK